MLEFGCPFKPGTAGEKDAEKAEQIMVEAAEYITALQSQLSIVEGARDTLYNLVGVEMALKEKAEAERDTWLSAHDAIYAELQSLKGDLKATEEHWKETDDRCGELQTGIKEATRLQKKAEMLLESSERCRATLGEELQQVKGEMGRYRDTLQWVKGADLNNRHLSRSALVQLACKALHPDTEAPK